MFIGAAAGAVSIALPMLAYLVRIEHRFTRLEVQVDTLIKMQGGAK